MTTGTDYNTKYINLRPNENTRSIVELLEAEKTSGYGDMTNIEIANLIEYKQYIATKTKELELANEHNKEMERIAQEEADKRVEETRARMNELLNATPMYRTVEEGSE